MQAHQKQVIAGFILSGLLWFVCFILFLLFLTPFEFSEVVEKLKTEKILSKVMVLCAIPHVVLFFYLLKINRDTMAKGVLLFAILLTLSTLFV